MKKNERARGPQVTAFYNPGPKWTLGLPGERTPTMKKKNSSAKGKGSQSHAKPNQFRGGGKSTSTAMTKFKPKKNSFQKRSFLSGFRNPLSRFTTLGGVSVIDIGVAGVTMIIVQGVSAILPGDPGSWVRILSQAGVVVGLVYLAPKSIKTPVAIGGGAVPAVAAINKLTNNAIGDLVTRATGYLQPAPAPAPTNLAGFRRGYRPTVAGW